MSSQRVGMTTRASQTPKTPKNPSSRNVARVRGPGDLAALVPELIGFPPTESLVVLCQHEPRGRVGLTMRFELVDDGRIDLAAAAVARVVAQDATRCTFLIFTEGDPRASLVERLTDLLTEADVRLGEVLLVTGGLWSSYTCRRPCCPPEGTPIPSGTVGPAGFVAAERVLAGGSLPGSREQLVSVLDLVDPLDPTVLDAAFDRVAGAVVADFAEAVKAEVAHLRAARDAPADLDDDGVARCVAALRIVAVRDVVLGWSLGSATELQTLGLHLLRRTPAADAAPVLVVTGAAAYAGGGGPLASESLERALRLEPDHRMALLLLTALDGAVAPETVTPGVERHLGEPRRAASAQAARPTQGRAQGRLTATGLRTGSAAWPRRCRPGGDDRSWCSGRRSSRATGRSSPAGDRARTAR